MPFMNAGADLDAIPNCINRCMKEIFWPQGAHVYAQGIGTPRCCAKLHGPVSCHVPVSLFQHHPDAKIYAIQLAATTPVVPAIRIYNK